MKTWIMLAAAFCLPASAVRAKEAFLSMAYTNALGEELPFSIFSKRSWAPDPKAAFVKLHLYFDEPISVQGMEIIACGGLKNPNLTVFFNFDSWVLRTDSALAGSVPDAFFPKRMGDTLRVEGFEDSIQVRSLTINFEFNTGFRICGINLKDPRGAKWEIRTPLLAAGTVSATSVLEPRSAYDPAFLFDSRFEHGWASDKAGKDVALDFAFAEPRRVEKLRVWNGYQRSVTHCWSNGRPRKLKITGDGGYAAEVALKDILGSQVVVLPKPFEGKNLRFTIVDGWPGKSYSDLVISELRFFDGKDWFLLDPSRVLKEGIAANRAAFAKAGLEGVLNNSFAASPGPRQKPEWSSGKLRLRADGSFYLSGTVDEENGMDYFALGGYEIKSAPKGIKLRLFGLYYESEAYGDCNGCGRDCNRADSSGDGSEQRIFQEQVVVRAGLKGRIQFEKTGGGKRIPFRVLDLAREAEPKPDTEGE